MRESTYDRCMNEHKFSYISSLGGNEFSCIVATKVLQIASSPNLLSNVVSTGDLLASELKLVCNQHRNILKGVRAFGLALSVEVATRDVGRALYKELFRQGVLCHSVAEIDPPSVKLFPPLVLTPDEARAIAKSVERAAALIGHRE